MRANLLHAGAFLRVHLKHTANEVLNGGFQVRWHGKLARTYLAQEYLDVGIVKRKAAAQKSE